MSITSNFPSASSSGSESYFFTSDGSVTLEAGIYFIYVQGAGGGAFSVYIDKGSYDMYITRCGAEGALIWGLVCSDTPFDVSCVVGKGGIGAMGTDSSTASGINLVGGTGGTTTVSLLGATLTAKGGVGSNYTGTNSSYDFSVGTGGGYTISTSFPFLLEGKEGLDYAGNYSAPTKNVYVGGFTYKDQLYGAGGQGIEDITASTLRDGTDGCVLIIKA